MSEKERYEKFRVMLSEAMDGYTGTQAEFARTAGIAPETLNRLINSDYISRPQKSTLKKIAGCARNGVTYEMLLESCGYSVHKEEKTPRQRIEDFQEKLLKEGLKTLAGGVYNNVDDFIDNVNMLYGNEDISYHIEKRSVLKGDENKGKCVSLVQFSFILDELRTVYADILVFYTRHVLDNYSAGSKQSKVYITNVETDSKQLRKYDSEVGRLYKEQSSDDDEYCIAVKSKPKKYEGVSPEQRLLEAIFGESEKKRQTKTVAVNGYGFAIGKISDEKLRTFLMRHKDAFCKSKAEKKIYEDFVEQKKPRLGRFGGYVTETATGAGNYTYLAMIVNIIHREWGINTQGWERNSVRNYDDLDFIVFSVQVYDANEMEKSLDKAKLVSILDEYARDLGSEVTECNLLVEA